MKRSLLIGLNTALVTAAIVGVGAPAQALITVFTDQTSFVNAIQPGAYTQNFNSLPVALLSSPLSFNGSGFGFSASAQNGFFPAGPSPSVSLSGNTATNPITLNNFVGSPTAFGGLFFLTDISGNFRPTGTMNVTVTAGSSTVTQSLTNPARTNFLGFISDSGAITSVVLNPTTGTSVWVTTDDVIVGRADAVPVPAPPMGVMGVVGLVLPWLRSRLKTLIKH